MASRSLLRILPSNIRPQHVDKATTSAWFDGYEDEETGEAIGRWTFAVTVQTVQGGTMTLTEAEWHACQARSY